MSSPNALRQTLIHHQESDFIGAGVEEFLEPFELAKYVKNAGQMLDRAARLTLFQPPHRVDPNAAAIGQRRLREAAPAAGEREVPAELGYGYGTGDGRWVISLSNAGSTTRGAAKPRRLA